jgi:hypothetical protein
LAKPTKESEEFLSYQNKVISLFTAFVNTYIVLPKGHNLEEERVKMESHDFLQPTHSISVFPPIMSMKGEIAPRLILLLWNTRILPEIHWSRSFVQSMEEPQ